MNRTIVKTGAALAIVAGLMGGVPAVPAAYADAPAPSAPAAEVTGADVKNMMEKLVSVRPHVTPESWIASDADKVLTTAYLSLNSKMSGSRSDVSYNALLVGLERAYDALLPGQNLTLFMDATDDYVRGENKDDHENSDLMRAHWVDDSAGRPGYWEYPLVNAVNGRVNNWGGVKPDGSPSYAGNAKLGDSAKKKAVYVQFDLEKSATISNFRIWRSLVNGDSYAHTALVVSDDPGFKRIEANNIAYYSGDSDVFGFGQMPKDPYYTETALGKDLLEGKSGIKGRYVRLYMNGTVNDLGGINYLLEVAINGADKSGMVEAYDTSELEGAIARVRALLRDHAGDYSAETVKALEESLAKAEDLLARIKNGTANENLGAVSDLVTNIEKAEQNLVKAYTVTFDDKIDATENVAIEAAEGTAIALPANPVHPQGYAFEGWFLDKEGKTAFDPAAHTTGDITVYAKWSTPAAELKPAEPVKPEVKPVNGKKPAKGGKLPQTGDASVFAVAASALGSAAAFAAARRRK